MQSVQELQLNNSQSESEINYITTKMDELVPQSEMVIAPDNSKKVSSPTQPKSLQQEFSMINMNIPNIEVMFNLLLNVSPRAHTIDESTSTSAFDAGECDGRDRKELHDNRVYKELQCGVESKFPSELSVQRTADFSVLHRHVYRQRDDDQTAKGPHANRSASRQEE